MKIKHVIISLIYIFFIIPPVDANSYNISIFNGGGSSNNALINRGTPFASGDVLNITASITATSEIGNIGSFPLTINGGDKTLDGGAVPTYAGFTIAAGGDYSFDKTNLDRFKSIVATSGGAITTAGIISFTDGDFNNNTGVNGGAIYNTGSETLTGTITGTGATATSTTTFYNNSSSTGLGGAIYTTGTSTITGVKFDSNDAIGTGASAGGGAIYTTGTTTVDDSIFTGNTSGRNAGAIYQTTGTLNLTDSLFDANTATNASTACFGGAVYSSTAGSILNITNTDFSNNSVKTTGGAIWTKATSTITGGTFSSNSATIGGAIYTNAATTISGASFISNQVSTALLNSGGGAIYNNATSTTITDTIFRLNSSAASALGGAVFNSNGTMSITGTITDTVTGPESTTYFYKNTSAANGGALYNNATTAGRTLDVTGVIFDSNSAANGGAVYNIAGVTTFTGDIFKDNSVTASGGAVYNVGTATFLNSDFSGNTAVTSGGAIYNSGTLRIQADGEESLFTNNKVGAVANDLHLGGGTVYLNAGNSGSITFNGGITSSAKANAININTLGASSSTLIDGTVNFKGDISTATINIAAGTTNIGSAVNTNETNVLFAATGGKQNFTNNTFLSGSRITLNDTTPTAGESLNITNGTFTGTGSFTGSGGAINVTLGTTNVTGSGFTGYTATTSGGAIYNDGTAANTVMTLTDDDFTTNTSVSGGAIYNTGKLVVNGTLSSSTSIFSGNIASTGNGGAIYTTGTSEITGVKFDANKADGTGTTAGGGAIYTTGTTTIDDSTFTGNLSKKHAGSIYQTTGTLTIKNSLFDSNIAQNGTTVCSGGAIYGGTAGSTLNLTNTDFTSNSSYSTGGAVSTRANSTITGGTFSLNSASIGGAIYSNGTSTISGVTFNDNSSTSVSANNGGGAIYNNAPMTIKNSTFNSNDSNSSTTADANGGAIFNSNGTVTISDSTFDLNSANISIGTTTKAYGGAIYNNDGAMTITRGSFTNNTAGTSGGAIYSNVTTALRSLSVSGASFSNNNSATCGAIYNAGTRTATLTNNTFSTNSATTDGGGAIYNTGVISSSGNTYTSNTATTSGGAINNTGGTITATGETFTSNTASANGGAVYNSGTATFTNSDFTGNGKTGATVNTINGGALYNTTGTTTLTDCSFSNNAATTSGGAIYIASGTLNINSTGEDVTFSGNTQGGSGNDILMAGGTLNLTANSKDIYINGGIQGTGTINKLGIGNLILSATSANNLFTGTYTNSAGNVEINSAFFNGANNFTAGTAQIKSGGSVIFNSGDTWTNTIITNSGGTMNFNSLSLTGSKPYNQTAGTLSLNNTTGTGSSLIVGSGTGINITGGNINFSGTLNTLAVATGGVLNSGVALNLTTGNIFTISGGTATLNGTGAGADTWAGTLNISSGTLNLNSMTSNGIYNQTGGTTNLDSNSILTISNTNDNLSGGSLLVNGEFRLSNTSAETVATAISGTGVVTRNGSGSVTYTGNNSNFTGTYNQTSGLATIQNSFFTGINNFIGGSVDVDAPSGNLTLNSNDTWTNTNILTSGGNFTMDAFLHTSGGTYNQTSGNLHLNNGSYLALNASNTISGGVVDYLGSGSTLDVNIGGNFSTGATLVLTLNTENIFKVSGGGATLNNTDTWGGLGKVDLTSGNLTLSGLTTNGIYTQSGGALTIGGAGTLTLGSNSSISGGSVAFSGTGNLLNVATGSTFAPAATVNISASNTFRVSGGTATLSNADTWAGTVDVTGGNLALNSIASNGTYTQSGGTTTLSSGTINLANASELSGGSLVADGTVNLTNTLAETVATTISGTGTINKNAAGTSTFTADNSVFTGTFNLSSDGIIIQNNFFSGINKFTGASTSAEIQTGGNLTLNSNDTWTTTNISTTGGSLTLDGFTHLAGGTYNQTSGALHINNSSSLTLSTSNSISGGTVDFGATGNLLNIATGGAFSSDTALNITSGNTFRVSGGTATLNGAGTGIDTWDGAINLTSGTLTVNNVSHSTGVYGTYSQSGGTVNFINQDLDTSSAIVLTGGTMNLNAGSGGSGYLRDKINATAGIININKTVGANPTDGTIYVNASIDPPSEVNLYNGTMTLSSESNISGNNLGLYGGTINTQNSLIGTMALNNLTFAGNANWLMDVNLATILGDKITSTNAATGVGSLNINGINVLTDAGSNFTSVLVADANTRSFLSTSVTEVTGALFKYGVTYDGAGGTLNFTKTGINPAASTGDVAQTSTFLLQAAIDRQFFGNVESFMSFPLAQRESTICCALNSKVASGQQTGAACPITGNGMFSPIYTCDLNRGIWAKNFVSFEDIPLRNGPRVSTIEYGTLIGADDVIKKLKYGFVGNTSAFIGYLGSNQNYEGAGVSQNGVMIGLAENMVKQNFFLTLMASVGSSLGTSNNKWGNDNFSSLFAGAAAKCGYNFEFKNGDYIIQPNLMLAYTFTNTPSYRTASGLDMQTKPLNAMQVAPGIRLIKNLKEQKGQVYLTSNFVYNFMDNTRFTANDIQLPQLSIAPYIEYGIGYQGVWKDRFTGFFQTLLRGGGRNGVAFQLGLRWAF